MCSQPLKLTEEREDAHVFPFLWELSVLSYGKYPSPNTSQWKHCWSSQVLLRHIPDNTGLSPSVPLSTSQTLQHMQLQNFLIILFIHTKSIIVISSIINITDYYNTLFYLSFKSSSPRFKGTMKSLLFALNFLLRMLLLLTSD